MPIRDTNLYPTLSAGYEQGQRNALLEKSVADEQQTRNLLADYTMSGATQEARQDALNRLLAQNPAAAQNVLTAERTQQQMGAEQDARLREKAVVEATSGLGLARYVRDRSSDPVRALEIADEDEAVRTQMRQMGLDPQNPADVAQTMDLLEARYSMIAGPGEERAEPAIIREMRAVGLDPASEEGRETWLSLKKAEGASDQALELLRTQLLGIQVQREQREGVEAERTAERERTQQRQTIIRGLDQTGKIADLTMKLEGTVLESGLPASDWRRTGASIFAAIGGATGADTKGLREQIDAYDQQKKNMQDQLINLMSTGGLGEATNSKLAQYQGALASPETSPGAIMAIQASIGEILLDQADAAGYEIPRRDEIEKRIEEMKAYSTPESAAVVDVPGAVRSVSDIARMGVEQLQALNPAEMSDEMIAAAARRWDQLNAAR